MSFTPTYLDKKRINIIGNMMMNQSPGKKSGVYVDRGGIYEGKADWYMKQLREKFPALTVEYAGIMDAKGTIDVIHVHSPACSQN